MGFGAGGLCVFRNQECEYKNNVSDCGNYRTYFMSEIERVKEEQKGLAQVVNALKLRKVNLKTSKN